MRSGRESLELTEDQLPAHSHSEPSLGNILGLDQESTDAGSKFTLQSSAVVFEPFTKKGTLSGHYVDQGKIDPGNATGGIELDGHFAKNKGVTVIELAG